jgi:two-component system alkaline phosphatase synthesis response regulator PhoP
MKSSDFTLMFAEDNPLIQKVYEKNFTREGYKVVLAEHGARAMAELKEQKVDLLVTDLEMPGMNSLEFLAVLKKDFPRLPVIVVSGHYLNLTDDFLAKGYAVNAVLSKPISVGVLKEKISQILKIDIPEKV